MQISISNSIKGSISGLGGGGSIGSTLAAAYRTRVLADGGTYENGACLTTFLNSLSPYGGNLLLGLYPNAAAAYSLRLVNPDYSGDAIRVRRSSDNAEQNIGFVNGSLDTASLLTFCGAGDGFVTTWYDQAASLNAAQTTAANQPQIVSSGATINDGGKPTINWDGINDHLFTAANYPTGSAESHYYIANSTGSNQRVIDTRGTGIAGTVLGWHEKYSDLGGIVVDEGSAFIQLATSNTGRRLITTYMSLLAIKQYYNNANLITATGTITSFNGSKPLYIGTNVDGANTQFYDGYLQEIILYPSDNSSNRSDINNNINSYYGIY